MIRKWIMRMIETEVERRMEDLERVEPYEVAEGMDASDVARHMDVNEVAGEFDLYDMAQCIEPGAIAEYVNIDAESMAQAAFNDGTLCKSEMASEMVSEIDMDELATLVVDELLSKNVYGYCHPEFFDEITNRVKVEVQP